MDLVAAGLVQRALQPQKNAAGCTVFLHCFFFVQFFLHGWIDGLGRVSAPVKATTRFAIFLHCFFFSQLFFTFFFLGWIDGLGGGFAPV